MKKDILEIYLNKKVTILLPDYTIHTGILYKVEDYAKRDISLKGYKNYYIIINKTDFSKNHILFKSSHVKEIKEITF